MKKILILLTIIFSSLTIFSATDYEKELRDFGINSKSIDAYTEYTKSTDTASAKEDLLKAIKLDNRNYYAYEELALILKKEGDLEGSIELNKKSIAIFPEGYISYQNIGSAYFSMGDYDNALKYYNILIEKHPDFSEGYYGVAYTYMIQEKYSDANKYALLSLEKLENFDKNKYPEFESYINSYKIDSIDILINSDYYLGNYQNVIDNYFKHLELLKAVYPDQDLQKDPWTIAALNSNIKIKNNKQKQKNNTQFEKIGINPSSTK